MTREAVISAVQGDPPLRRLQGGWLGWATAWLRRVASGSTASQGALRVESRMSLGPKKSLVLVNCRGREVLLAVSGDSITAVMDMGEPSAGTKKIPGTRRLATSARKEAAQ